jgi:isopentenyl-diphosphate delta-isomerase
VSSDDDLVVLVDAEDRPLGTAGKLDAHIRGLRHRAISALVCNSRGEILLQRRNPAKYHSGGLWSNACCSHPLPGEDVSAAAHRRLMQEMGVRCPLEPMFVESYRAEFGNGLIEDEVVHVFGGLHDGPITPDPDEVSEWTWVTLPALVADQHADPAAYTVWFVKYVHNHQKTIAEWVGRSVAGSDLPA